MVSFWGLRQIKMVINNTSPPELHSYEAAKTLSYCFDISYNLFLNKIYLISIFQ